MTSLQGADVWICQSGFLHTGIVRIATVGESLAMSLSERTSLPSLGRLRPRMIVPSQLFPALGCFAGAGLALHSLALIAISSYMLVLQLL